MSYKKIYLLGLFLSIVMLGINLAFISSVLSAQEIFLKIIKTILFIHLVLAFGFLVMRLNRILPRPFAQSFMNLLLVCIYIFTGYLIWEYIKNFNEIDNSLLCASPMILIGALWERLYEKNRIKAEHEKQVINERIKEIYERRKNLE